MDEKNVSLKPMSNIKYKSMALLYKISSPFCSVKRQIELMQLRDGMVVVDWGCGTGRHTIQVAKSVGDNGKVFAVDIQPLAIKNVRENAKQNGLNNIQPLLISSYNTGVENASVDLVLLIDIIPTIKDTRPMFSEIHRLLKNDGRAYISHSHLSMEKTRKLVEDSSIFTVSECQGHDMIIVPVEKRDSASS
jgi:ubiquinone/menaquinone biosynthesis C-methylase UbiE